MKTVLLLGAGSDVAVAIAKVMTQKGHTVLLAGRDLNYLKVISSDLSIRYSTAKTEVHYFDATDFESHAGFYNNLPNKPDVTICAFGYLGEQIAAQTDFAECKKIIDSNYLGAVSILNVVANEYEKKGKGTIVGISSVAGERGRQSNYLYGSAKAGFTAYLSGLRNRMVKSNVHVMTLIPGFIKTKMLKEVTPAPLTAIPDKLASSLYTAIVKKKDVVYYLPVWRLIMFIIRSIPEGIFKKLKL